MKTITDIKNEKNSIILLGSFLNLLPRSIISANSKVLLQEGLKVPTKNIMTALGSVMIRCDSSIQSPLDILNDCWKTLNDLEEISDYIPCVAIWIEFVAIHFQPKEINKLLGGIIKRIQEIGDRLYDANGNIESMVTRLIKRSKPGVLQLLRIQNFLPLI